MDKPSLHMIRLPGSDWWRLMPLLLLVLALLSGGVAVVSLRHNNLRMVELRQAVYDADKSDGDVETALRNLRGYVYSHMNTDLSSGGNAIKPPIQLKYRYERLLAAEKQTAASTNDKVYTDAQAYCEEQNSTAFSGRSRVPCIQEYVNSHGASAKPVPDAQYKFDFVSPSWTPDLAGWSLVIAISSAAASLVCWQLNRHISRRHHLHA